jgi:hypothetical protein
MGIAVCLSFTSKKQALADGHPWGFQRILVLRCKGKLQDGFHIWRWGNALIILNDNCYESGEMILSYINGEWLPSSKITSINGTDMMVGYCSAGGEWMQRWLRLYGVDTVQCDILKLRKFSMLGILLTVMAFLIGQEVSFCMVAIGEMKLIVLMWDILLACSG